MSISTIRQPASARTGVLSGVTSTKILFGCPFANTQDTSIYTKFINVDNER